MKKLSFLIALSFTLYTCREDDPGPDLSATISFTWDFESVYEYYLVVSDSTGIVHGWTKIPKATPTQLPYLADTKQAVLTIIKKYTQGAYLYAGISTFTQIPAGNYTIADPVETYKSPDGSFELTLTESNNYQNVLVYANPDAYWVGDYSTADWKFSFGLYDSNPKHDLLISAGTAENSNDYRYKYIENINEGASITITPEDFEDFTVTPFHVINYPEHPAMYWSLGFVIGTPANKMGSFSLYAGSWYNNQIPKFAYPEIPGLFAQYESIMIGFDTNGDSYVTDIKSTEPLTSFSNLNTTLINHETTTKRLSADASGDGDVLFAYGTYNLPNRGLEYSVTAPVSSKTRINSPQFPDDLKEEIPTLINMQDKSLDFVSIYDLDMTYNEFINDRFGHDLNSWPDFVKGKSYRIDHDNSRTSNGAAGILKQLGKENLIKNIKN